MCTAPSILRGHARPCPRGGDLGSPDPSQVTRRLCMGRSPGRSPDMEVTPSTPCWEGPSQTRHAQPHRGPWETRQSPPQPLSTTTLPPPPPLRHDPDSPNLHTASGPWPDSLLSPAVPSHASSSTLSSVPLTSAGAPGRGLGQHPRYGRPHALHGQAWMGWEAGSGPVPPHWWPHSLPISSSKTEQRSENKFLSSDFRHETRSKRLGTPSPTVKLAVWSPCRPRCAPRAPVSSSRLCL